MKTFRSALLPAALGLPTLALASFTVPAIAATSFRKLPTRSGHLTCKVSAGAFDGTATLAWTDWGANLRQDTHGTAAANGRQQKVSQWAIATGGHVYFHDDAGPKVVMRGTMPHGGPPPGLMLLGPSKTLGKPIGKATLLGKPCEVRQLGPGKAWYWGDLPLQMEIRQADGSLTRVVATHVDETPPPATAFHLPSGYTVRDVKPRGGGAPPGR